MENGYICVMAYIACFRTLLNAMNGTPHAIHPPLLSAHVIHGRFAMQKIKNNINDK